MLLALHASAALACGGFFCNNLQPVDQSAERVLFAEDPATGEVEVHVQVFYEGPSEAFAWVVPVPSTPEILLSSDAMFNDLATAYQPLFRLDVDHDGDCTFPIQTWTDGGQNGGGSYGGGATAPQGTGGAGVVVVDTLSLGAYETVTLQADSRDALVDWLVAHDYDLPDAIGPALDPYVAAGSSFVAMRLTNDADAGQIQPIAFRYPADGFSIPIQLTAIAARPGLPLEVYVLGEHRAVPESYLHVEINEAAMHWFGGLDNYLDVIGQAADEAGGHAFATDAVADATLPAPHWYEADRYETDVIASTTNPAETVLFTTAMFESTPLLLSLLEIFVPPPPGVDAIAFYNNPVGYEIPEGYTWDPIGLAAALEERIVEPNEHIGSLFDAHPTLSRLTSSLDAAEMTVDPTFVFNADMEQRVDTRHDAVDRYLCGDGMPWDEAPRELELPDGRLIELPSAQWFEQNGMTEDDYLEPLGQQAAMIIAQSGAAGEPEVLVDNHAEQDRLAGSLLDDAPARAGDDAGCSCSTRPSPAPLILLLAPAFLARRRRHV